MDPATLVQHISPAPASSDAPAVLLWVVGVLFVGVVLLVRWAAANHKKCEERSAKLEEKVDTIQTTVIKKQFEESAATRSSMEKMTEAVTELTSTFRASGPQATRSR